MQTVTDNIRRTGANLSRGIESLLGDNTRMHDINEQSSGLVFVGPHYAFDDLPIDKRRLQSRLGEDHKHFISVVRALLRAQPDSVRNTVDQFDNTVSEIIEQTRCWYSTTDEAMAVAKKAIDKILDAVSGLHDQAEGSVVLVPDTNALIHSPAFHTWAFEGIQEFEILLVPTLLSELDSLKTEHRNPDVRQKAQDVIRQVKEYRRRGSLNDGVVVVRDRIRLRASAVEPQVQEALPWLDAASPDDRMLASCIETMRAHPRSSVVLVTGDINLQNKAEFALVPFFEPPDNETRREATEHPA